MWDIYEDDDREAPRELPTGTSPRTAGSTTRRDTVATVARLAELLPQGPQRSGGREMSLLNHSFDDGPPTTPVRRGAALRPSLREE